MEDMGYFSRLICTDWIQGQLPMSGEENVLYLPPGMANTFLTGNPAFR